MVKTAKTWKYTTCLACLRCNESVADLREDIEIVGEAGRFCAVCGLDVGMRPGEKAFQSKGRKHCSPRCTRIGSRRARGLSDEPGPNERRNRPSVRPPSHRGVYRAGMP